MSFESAIIRSATGNVIKVSHPKIPESPKTYLTASVSAGGTTLTVLDNTGTTTTGVGFSNNDYLIIGEPGSDKSEIVQVDAAVTDGTSITISALVFDHPIDTPVTKVLWNQIEFSGATTASGSKTVFTSTTNGLIGIQPEREESVLVMSTTADKAYAFVFARFKNQETGDFSAYSDAYDITGIATSIVRSVKDEALDMVNEKISDLITNDFLNKEILNCDNEVWAERRHWSWADTFNSIIGQTEDGGYSVSLPTDISDPNSDKSILEVRIEDRSNLDYVTKEEFDRLMVNVHHTTLNGAVTASDTTITLTDSSDFDLSGSFVIAGTSVTATLTGTIDPAASTTVTGVGTLFTTEVHVDDYIVVSGETRRVTAIASATSLTVAAAFTDGANDASPDVIHAHADTVDYTDNIKPSNLLAGVTNIQHGGHATGTHVWQGATFGEPRYYTVQDGVLYFSTPVSSDFAQKNIYLSYYRKPTVVNSDYDTLNILDVTIYHYYLAWKILLKKNNGVNSPESEAMRLLYEKRKDILKSRERTGQRSTFRPRLNKLRYTDAVEATVTTNVIVT